MSLAFAEKVMDMDLPDPDHKNFARVLAIKTTISQSILTVAARVNGGSLRRAKDDGLSDLLRHLEGEGEFIDPFS